MFLLERERYFDDIKKITTNNDDTSHLKHRRKLHSLFFFLCSICIILFAVILEISRNANNKEITKGLQ